MLHSRAVALKQSYASERLFSLHRETEGIAVNCFSSPYSTWKGSMKMKSNTKNTASVTLLGGCLALGLLSSMSVHASALDGSSVTAAVYCCTAPTETYRISNFSNSIVFDGIEFPQGSFTSNTGGIFVIPLNIDIGATTIDFDYTASASALGGTFNGSVFSFSGAPTITNVTINPASTFSPSGLSFTSNSVLVNVAGLNFSSSSRLLLDVSLAPVPEPSTYAMLAAGLLPVFLAYRRRNRHQA